MDTIFYLQRIPYKARIEEGFPDLVVLNEKEFFFCEVKTENDGWGYAQIKWFLEHSEFPYLLLIIKNKKELKGEEREIYNQMKSLYDRWEGLSTYALAKLYGCSPRVIRERLKGNFPSKPRKKLKKLPEDVYKNLLDKIKRKKEAFERAKSSNNMEIWHDYFKIDREILSYIEQVSGRL